MSDGELKKHLREWIGTTPYNFEGAWKIVDEAKKDILEQLNKISITNPILVNDLIKLRFKIKKWFGDSE